VILADYYYQFSFVWRVPILRVVLGEEEKIVLFERVVVPVDIDDCQKWRRARYWLVLLATEVFSVEAEFAIKKIFFFHREDPRSNSPLKRLEVVVRA
jgi:hypothetical protein